MIRETRCMLLICDSCGAQPENEDGGFTPHYASRNDAQAAEHYWSVDGERDLCPRCTCKLRGHDWAKWWTPPDTSRAGAVRWCDRCPALEIEGEGVLS